MVKIRLQVISLKITLHTSRLYNRHDGKGVVFVMMSNTALSVQWEKSELSIEYKENLKKSGYLALSPEEIITVVEELADRIDPGHLAEAVEWINRYEPFLLLNEKKLL